MEIKEVIKLWKKLKISEVFFNFSCGGDSMNDTDIVITNTSGKDIVNDEIAKYFDDEVYRNVTFYECSDGYYQGEAGMVIITLNDDDDGFMYNKQAEAEFSENVTSVFGIKLTKSEQKFIKDKILNINGGESDYIINFKGDFILTDEEEKIVEELEIKVLELTAEFTPEIEFEGELDEWYTFTTGEEIKIVEGKLVVEINNQIRVYRESE